MKTYLKDINLSKAGLMRVGLSAHIKRILMCGFMVAPLVLGRGGLFLEGQILRGYLFIFLKFRVDFSTRAS